jgi:PAS domain S-box-containing protein
MDERLHYERGFSDRLLRSSTDGIMVIDRELRCTVWNPGMERMWGKTEAECLGKCALDLFPFLKETGEDQLFRAVLLGDSFEAKDRYYKAPETGEEGYYEASYCPLSDEAGNIIGCLGFVRDVTARRRAEGELKESREQLRALAARMESVREEERTRMSREIHDEMGHGLTTLKMELAQLRKRIIGAGAGMLAIRGTLAKSIEEMSGLVDQTIQSVRRIATELRPGVLDHLGITAAIEWLAQDFEKRTGIVCRAILPQQEVNLNEKQSTGLFRIAQEILTNAAKHSRATEVNIGLQEEEGKLVLAVHDNGQGFSKRSLFDTQSLGILGMEERARLLGGELEIRGEKKKGTTVVVRIPLRANL